MHCESRSNATLSHLITHHTGQNSDFPKAIECYKKALSYDPRMKEACCGLGLVYANMKEYEAALAAFEEVPTSRALKSNGPIISTRLCYVGVVTT